jgi:hypothetical protein
MEPLAFQFQDDAAENALIFEKFDNIAGFHSGLNVTKSPEKSRKVGAPGGRQRFEANKARLKMGLLAYNLLHMIRQFYVVVEEMKRSIDWFIKRLIKLGARVS